MFKKVALVLFIAVLAMLVPLSVMSVLRDETAQKLGPLGNVLIRFRNESINTFHSLSQINDLRKQKEDLQKEIIQLHQDLNEMETVKKENQNLRNELGITNINPNTPKAFAKVVIHGNNPLDKTLTINIGSDQGVKIGQPAVNQGHLIGKVISVNKNSAIVRSINSRNSRVQAIINDSQEKGLLIGDGNIIYITDITQGTTQKEESLVTTSGLGGSLPSGLLIGTLGAVQSKVSDLSQKFMVNPPFDPSMVDSVFILLMEIDNTNTGS